MSENSQQKPWGERDVMTWVVAAIGEVSITSLDHDTLHMFPVTIYKDGPVFVAATCNPGLQMTGIDIPDAIGAFADAMENLLLDYDFRLAEIISVFGTNHKHAQNYMYYHERVKPWQLSRSTCSTKYKLTI